MPSLKSMFWSLLRRNTGRHHTPPPPVRRPELEDTQPLPLLPLQAEYVEAQGVYRPRRQIHTNTRWHCNSGARRRVGNGVDSRVEL